jgi:transposase
MRGMLTSGVVLPKDNARPHTAARTRSLLEHFSWEMFDHPPYSPDLAPSEYHLFTYLKNWLRSQRFNKNEELIEAVKKWLSSQAHKNFIPDTSASVPSVIMLRSSLNNYVFYVWNTFFLVACFVNSSQEFTFRIDPVHKFVE